MEYIKDNYSVDVKLDRHYNMCKPRLRTDIKQVYIYNGYWLLDYGDGTVTAVKHTGVTCSLEDAIKEIDHQTKAECIQADIEKLKKGYEQAQASSRALADRIADKYELLEKLKGE